MALRDWKKWKHSIQDNIVWNKGNSQVQVVFLSKSNEWLVTTWKTDEDSREDKTFSTKAQAMTFANNYRRTH